MTTIDLIETSRATESRAADLTVVGGAGHVGIPLVLAFAAKGLTVNVNDLNTDSLATLAAGRLPFIEYGADELLTDALRNAKLLFSNSPAAISKSKPVIITIGTPVDEFLNPERHVILDCIDSLLPYLSDGQLLVLRSTLYPGTTESIAVHLARRGRNLKVAFCPERIVQGHGIEELSHMPQIVSGTTSEAAEEAAALFDVIAPEIVRLEPIEAEFAKLFGNAYRYIEFAATNQFYLIAQAAGLDYHRILKAMKHNYPRARNIPRPGYAAGPCLMKDTMQLSAFARNDFSLGNAAMLINEGLPLHVIGSLRRQIDLAQMTVGLLGMAFKSEIDDVRASLSYKFKKALNSVAREVLTTDPFVVADPDLLPLDEVIERSDVLILCTPHMAYKSADLKGKPVVDVWGLLENANFVS
ncbi:nucleotide sugar dehydrogenase [Bradyrhizobium erythrophlei]|uniref:UDP-N-acetyl-D-mannosaminuronic acid dehydrogenase n=1 Tax=Bradyrhizobium erythrophlei TaxID=1437360 RepID=A0A1M7UHA0_9BRAD|nr:nucleotide sugar dehydrogenase [Bradyrhizobium erythrophlei]SHN82316.1 UDP-N-acetyl-D-mannosaminuronic acid dehydrogenase [Bradyrhizobium erythrophlei]